MAVQDFLNQLAGRIQPLSIRSNLAYWRLSTAYSDDAAAEYSQAKKELLQLFSDSALFQELCRYRAEPHADPLAGRQVDLLYHTFLGYQVPPGLLEEIIALENRIESEFVNFRAQLGQQTVSDNDLHEILARTPDPDQARQAWEASKQIGYAVAPHIIELVKLRNRSAQLLGFPDFFQLSLFLNELDRQELFGILDQLAQLSEAPYLRLKQDLDRRLAAKFSVGPADLQPWHYGDPFFQELPKVYETDLDPYYDTDPLPVAGRFYREIGLDPQPVLDRSDLYERPGKSQHAFCTDIDQAGDVRILCNLRPNQYWLSTILHELGHGVYDLNHDYRLPYLLRTPAHILTTEAIAMMMGRLTKNPDWLRRYLGVSDAAAREIGPVIQRNLARSELIFIRWGLVMVHFESRLYQNPDQDLTGCWWDLVAAYQKIAPRDRTIPGWAAKIHIGTAPVYYQNYILGDLAASQISAFIRERVSPDGTLFAGPAVGAYLTAAIFRPGASLPWPELMRQATGAPLSAEAFGREMQAVSL